MSGEKPSAESFLDYESSQPLSREQNRNLGEMALEQTDKKEKEIEDAREDVKYFSQVYRDATSSFAEKKKNGLMSYEDYQEWEDDADFAFSKMVKAEEKAEFEDVYDKDATERLSVNEGKDSIEAYAGHFFRRRERALVDAIEKNEDKEASKEDYDTVKGLHMLVVEHVAAILDYDLKSSDVKQYQANRRDAHNKMIQRLNDISELCEKYGVKRLIFRNLMRNDRLKYDEKDDWSGQTNGRAEYDRSAAETYASIAFSRDFEEIEKEEKRGRSDLTSVRFH